MFGIEDKAVLTSYVLCIVSTLVCLVYGVLNWNRGAESVDQDDIHWVEEEKKVDEEF